MVCFSSGRRRGRWGKKSLLEWVSKNIYLSSSIFFTTVLSALSKTRKCKQLTYSSLLLWFVVEFEQFSWFMNHKPLHCQGLDMEYGGIMTWKGSPTFSRLMNLGHTSSLIISWLVQYLQVACYLQVHYTEWSLTMEIL